MRYLGEAEAKEGAPSGARDKRGVGHLGRGTPATGSRPKPGYRVGEGPAQSSQGPIARVGHTAPGRRLPTYSTSPACGPEDWLGVGRSNRFEQLLVSQLHC